MKQRWTTQSDNLISNEGGDKSDFFKWLQSAVSIGFCLFLPTSIAKFLTLYFQDHYEASITMKDAVTSFITHLCCGIADISNQGDIQFKRYNTKKLDFTGWRGI